MSSGLWAPAYIALGSNLNDPVQQVQRALQEIGAIRDTRMVLRSSLYRSAPMGPQDQPHFVNAVAGVLTQLSAGELLAELQVIEQRFGRTRRERWGPRVIDLDLLMHGDTRSDSEQLKLPHPGMHERNFVMTPLAEIAPELFIGKGIARPVASALGTEGLAKLDDR